MDRLLPCPFCGRTDTEIKTEILEHRMGQDCPCSTLRKVWIRCNYCGAEGRKRTIDAVYDSEITAAAIVGWNSRKSEV